MVYIRYSDSIETIAPDEQSTFDQIIEVMAGGGKITRERYGRSVRTSHAKGHGLLKGELRILDGLAPELRQGLFAEPCPEDRSPYVAVARLVLPPQEAFTPEGDPPSRRTSPSAPRTASRRTGRSDRSAAPA